MFLRYRLATSIGALGGIIKVVCIALADIATTAWAVWLAVDGRWGIAAVIFFIGVPIVSFVVDIATGVVLALLVGIATLIGWKAAAPDEQYEPDFEA